MGYLLGIFINFYTASHSDYNLKVEKQHSIFSSIITRFFLADAAHRIIHIISLEREKPVRKKAAKRHDD